MATIPGLQVSQPFQEIWSHDPIKPEHSHGHHTWTSGEPTLSGDLVPCPLEKLSMPWPPYRDFRWANPFRRSGPKPPSKPEHSHHSRGLGHHTWTPGQPAALRCGPSAPVRYLIPHGPSKNPYNSTRKQTTNCRRRSWKLFGPCWRWERRLDSPHSRYVDMREVFVFKQLFAFFVVIAKK